MDGEATPELGMGRASRLPRQQLLVLRPLLWPAPSAPAVSRRRRRLLQLQPRMQACLLPLSATLQHAQISWHVAGRLPVLVLMGPTEHKRSV